jgi:hypothetical protein
MENLKIILNKLKTLGASGIKISYEDEGALLNEIITMRYLTALVGIDLSIKIGGCEAKRDIVDCLNLNCDIIVAPMCESKFSLEKFSKAIQQYNYSGKKGVNIETINAYNSINEISDNFNIIDFITIGRVDLVSSMDKNRDYVNDHHIYDIVFKTFKLAKAKQLDCYLGGAISIESKDFIGKLINENLLDKFETRYVMFDTLKIDFNNYEQLIYWANIFEVEWLKLISERYSILFKKDIKRIEMIEKRIQDNVV